MSAVIRIDILGDSRSAQRSARDAERGYDRLGRGANRSSSGVNRLGSALGSAARRYGPLAAAAAGYGILKIGKDSLRAASDVQQAFGSIDAVFGSNAAAVKRWAKDAADDVGLAKSQYAQLAVVAGSMLKNTGIEGYAGKTKQLIKLGADLAATYGGTTLDAMTAINALFRGEADPIERYGVNIKQAAINAYLAANGLDKLTGSGLEQAKQQARLALLFEQTTAAQGRFRAESDTLAVSQQKLGARYENLLATLGERFLPVATRVVKWLDDTIDGSNRTGVALRKIGSVIDSFLSPIIDGIVDGWHNFTDAMSDAGVSGKDTRDILNRLGVAAEYLAPIVGGVLGGMFRFAGTAAGYLATSIAAVVGWISTLIGWINSAIDKLGQLASALSSAPTSKMPIGFGGLGGLFNSGAPLPGGLGRAAGMGAFGYGGGGSIRVSAAPVQIFLDGRALAASYYSVGRQAARDEISTQVRGAKGPGR